MKGCRPFTDEEADAVMESFTGPYMLRDKAIFALGRYTGERISAILRLRVRDVMGDCVSYKRENRKGKQEGRIVPLHPKAKMFLDDWIKSNNLGPDSYIFFGKKGWWKPIGRVQYHRILEAACATWGLSGKIATHSMRKTFADRVYEGLGKDLFRTQKALGHKNVNSTVQYLSFKVEDIDRAILGM